MDISCTCGLLVNLALPGAEPFRTVAGAADLRTGPKKKASYRCKDDANGEEERKYGLRRQYRSGAPSSDMYVYGRIQLWIGVSAHCHAFSLCCRNAVSDTLSSVSYSKILLAHAVVSHLLAVCSSPSSEHQGPDHARLMTPCGWPQSVTWLSTQYHRCRILVLGEF